MLTFWDSAPTLKARGPAELGSVSEASRELGTRAARRRVCWPALAGGPGGERGTSRTGQLLLVLRKDVDRSHMTCSEEDQCHFQRQSLGCAE